MAEEKKNQIQTANSGLDRREFFVRLGLGSLGVAAAGTVAFGYSFCRPTYFMSLPRS